MNEKTILKHVQFVRVPWGWPFWGGARYFGRRWATQIGPWLILIWQLTPEQLEP